MNIGKCLPEFPKNEYCLAVSKAYINRNYDARYMETCSDIIELCIVLFTKHTQN